jgi:hypothetical protein
MVDRTRTLREAFAHFGAKATNPVWGWSARSEDGKTVVLTLWDEEDESLVRQGASVSVDNFGHWELARWTDARGNRDRIRNLRHAQEHCDGLFRVVWVVAKDTSAHRRSIRDRRPDETLVMRLTCLDEKTGEFRAVSVDS